jgi:molybdenum cofactor synthesis domain-containing protein
MSTVSHLAIGSEILLGQTLNSNSHKLAVKLYDLGFSSIFQLACRDERREIKSLLSFAAQHSEILVVTGGLGPTRDDFTREVVAEFVGLPLEWREEAWLHLKTHLEKRQLPLREAHKRECYFPQGARLFHNSLGTALGFAFRTEKHLFLVLPGPPREIECMWSKVSEYLRACYPQLSARRWSGFMVFGEAESAVAEKIERGLVVPPEVEVAYRIDLPYVEFKLIFPETLAHQSAQLLRQARDLFPAERVVESKSFVLQQASLAMASLWGEGNTWHVLSENTPELWGQRLSGMPTAYVGRIPRSLLHFSAGERLCFWDFTPQESVKIEFWHLGQKIKELEFTQDLSPHYSLERRQKYVLEKALLAMGSRRL